MSKLKPITLTILPNEDWINNLDYQRVWELLQAKEESGKNHILDIEIVFDPNPISMTDYFNKYIKKIKLVLSPLKSKPTI